MIDVRQMIERFSALSEAAVSNPDTLGVLKNSVNKMFNYLSERDQRKAEEMLAELEQIQYNNYLTQEEAKRINASFKNYDGSTGGKWRSEEVENFLRNKGLPVEDLPYYNSCALVVAMNRISSDYGGEIKELTDDYAVACYRFALCDLKDDDRPRWIRKFFEDKL